MSDLLVRDAQALHRALATSGPQVKVALSRETAELVSQLIDARARGEEILVSPGKAEVTPTEAATWSPRILTEATEHLNQNVAGFNDSAAGRPPTR